MLSTLPNLISHLPWIIRCHVTGLQPPLFPGGSAGLVKRHAAFHWCVYPAGTSLLEWVHVNVEQYRSLESCNSSKLGLGRWKIGDTPTFYGCKTVDDTLQWSNRNAATNLPVAGIGFQLVPFFSSSFLLYNSQVRPIDPPASERLSVMTEKPCHIWSNVVILALVPLHRLLPFQQLLDLCSHTPPCLS